MLKPKKLLSLLATATAATALTACAGAGTGAGIANRAAAPRAPIASTVEVRSASAPIADGTPDVTPADVMPADLMPAPADTPLLNPSGRPACGNVQTKSSDSMRDCTELAAR